MFSLPALNNDLVSDIYVGDDGKLHKVQGGADTVLPFSKCNLIPETDANESTIRIYGSNNGGGVVVDVTNYSTIKATKIANSGTILSLALRDAVSQNILAIEILKDALTNEGADISNFTGKYLLFTRGMDFSFVDVTFIK